MLSCVYIEKVGVACESLAVMHTSYHYSNYGDLKLLVGKSLIHDCAGSTRALSKMSGTNLLRAYGHVAAAVDGKLYLWGGVRKGAPKVHDGFAKTAYTSMVDVLDLRVT